MKMVSKYHQKTKKSFKNKHAKGTKIFLMKKKTKSPNMLKKDIKILLKKKKKKGVTIIRNVSKSYLSIEEIII